MKKKMLKKRIKELEKENSKLVEENVRLVKENIQLCLDKIEKLQSPLITCSDFTIFKDQYPAKK